MARKRQEDRPSGSPAWMSTFSDLMNLLLCFFILLFASSTVDAEKLEQVSAAYAKANIFQAGSTAIGDGKMVSSGMSQLSLINRYVTSLGKDNEGDSANLSDKEAENKKENVSTSKSDNPKDSTNSDTENKESTEAASSSEASSTTQSVADLKQQLEAQGLQQSARMNEEINNMAKASQISDDISVDYTAQYVRISMNGGILFPSGSAELTGDAKALLSKVGDILVKYRKRDIEIEGHTDNVPAAGSQYKDNQYLSSARAISVYEYLLDSKNLIAANMRHSGYGDSRPVASNRTAKGRAKNRRVEIKIYNQANSD